MDIPTGVSKGAPRSFHPLRYQSPVAKWIVDAERFDGDFDRRLVPRYRPFLAISITRQVGSSFVSLVALGFAAMICEI